MLRHAAILAAAILSAIVSSQGLMAFMGAHSATAQAAPAATAQRLPPQPLLNDPGQSAPQAAAVAKGPDGHFWAQANVNGSWVKFLVDTGASAVALTANDAQRLGVDLDGLRYDRPVVTANGQTLAAQIKLDNVTVAGARVEDVDALVVREGLSTSLLGMTYLGRLSRFEATKTALILRP